jgi:multidrug efflux pump subunit AcrB
VSGFNLSRWALKHTQLVLFLMLLLGASGVYAYLHLGQMEDPEFTVKVMVVQANWPGASADEVAQQVTDRLERKLQEIAEVDNLTSFSKPGVSQITIELREDVASEKVPDIWYQVRGFRVRRSTTSSETLSEICMRSPATASTTPSSASSSIGRATSSCGFPMSVKCSISACRTKRSSSKLPPLA